MTAEPGSSAVVPTGPDDAGSDGPVATNGAAPADGAAAPERRPPIVTLVLVRHGRSTSNVAGTLAGQTPGVRLDDHGLEQAAGIAQRLAGTRFDRLITSPLERCRQTVAPFAQASGLPVEIDEHFVEVDYGQWSGLALKDLSQEPLWRTVQQHPSAAVFPGGEGLADVSARAAAGIRALRSAAESDQTVLVCSHGDVIKAILADALGMHLDAFQRIVVAPASISVIRYTPLRPFVERINDTGDLGFISPQPAPTAATDQPESAASSNHPTPAAPTDDPESSSDAVPGGVLR